MNQPKISTEFKHYLELLQLNKESMSTTELIKTQRAFYGGVGQTLAVIAELAEVSQEEGTEAFNAMVDEVAQFWRSQF